MLQPDAAPAVSNASEYDGYEYGEEPRRKFEIDLDDEWVTEDAPSELVTVKRDTLVDARVVS